MTPRTPNPFMVAELDDTIIVPGLSPRRLTRDEAIDLAAWLVAKAAPRGRTVDGVADERPIEYAVPTEFLDALEFVPTGLVVWCSDCGHEVPTRFSGRRACGHV